MRLLLDECVPRPLKRYLPGHDVHIRHASKQGIPYFQLEGDELEREIDASKKL